MDQLINWLHSAGSKTDESVRVVHLGDKGYGIVHDGELESLSCRKILIEVPSVVLINYCTSMKYILKSSGKLGEVNKLKMNLEFFRNMQVPEDEESFYNTIDVRKLVALTSYQVVGFFLASERNRSKSFWKSFCQCLPAEISSFQGMPITWEWLNLDHLYDYTPSEILEKVNDQKQKFESDFQAVSALGMEIQKEDFFWAWLCINSRCIYVKLPVKQEEDNWTLCPMVDFINHCNEPNCEVVFKNGIQVVTSETLFGEGSGELYFSYGNHANAFLFTEYGFVLQDNQWEELDLTGPISHRVKTLGSMYVDFLQDLGYWGEYTVSMQDISFRTTVGLSLLSTGSTRKVKLLVNGYLDEEEFEQKNSEIFAEILKQSLLESETGASKSTENYAGECLKRYHQERAQICKLWLQKL